MDNNRLILLNGAEYVDIATLADQRGIPLITVHKPSLSSDNQGGRSGRAKTVERCPALVQRMIKEGR
jgi:hypothetical protein|tara:strand:- start:1390 stop:1590 length:201 start_codon:yes stop_codon:yes gene_type:complete